MLAYVFWHWKRPDAPAREYEQRQRAFHAALAAAPPPGYSWSFSVSISGAPWAASGGGAYEDWYLMRDYAALGELNDGAVAGSRSAPHAAAAVLVSGGSGGLYRLRSGMALAAPAYSYWFGKPEGMPYSALLSELEPLVARANAALWMRQMVFGPAPEFCLHAMEPLELPSALEPLVVPLRQAWPDPDGA